MGVERGGRSRRHPSGLEKQDGVALRELTERSPQYWAEYRVQWRQKEMPPISISFRCCHGPASSLRWIAAENAPSCTKPQLYWFPFKAPVEGMWKNWVGTMVESRPQSSQRVRFSSSPNEITSH